MKITLDEQVKLYEYLKERFSGTELEKRTDERQLEEFAPDYCTNCFNCSEKFFLMQPDGNLYSCIRGHGSDQVCYGNIFETQIPDIMQLAPKKISFVPENQKSADNDFIRRFL